MAAENPLTQIVIPVVTSTHKEYLQMKTHMEQFKDTSMKIRFDSLMEKLKESEWDVFEHVKDALEMDNLVRNSVLLHDEIEDDFTSEGNVVEGFSIVAKMSNTKQFTILAYEQGLLFYKKAYQNNFYQLCLFPDNNIPGAPFVPIIDEEKDLTSD